MKSDRLAAGLPGPVHRGRHRPPHIGSRLRRPPRSPTCHASAWHVTPAVKVSPSTSGLFALKKKTNAYVFWASPHSPAPTPITAAAALTSDIPSPRCLGTVFCSRSDGFSHEHSCAGNLRTRQHVSFPRRKLESSLRKLGKKKKTRLFVIVETLLAQRPPRPFPFLLLSLGHKAGPHPGDGKV